MKTVSRRVKFLAARRLVEADAEMIGIDIAQVDALLLGAGKQRVGAAGRVNGHGIEEGFGGDFITKRRNCARKNLGEAMGARGRFADAFGAVVNREHRGDDGKQNLRGADIAGGLFAPDMLLAGLHRHAERAVAFRVDGYADDAARHGALVFIARGKEGGMRAAIAHGNAEALGRTDGDVGAQFAGRREQRKRQQIGRHDGKGAGAMELVDDARGNRGLHPMSRDRTEEPQTQSPASDPWRDRR